MTDQREGETTNPHILIVSSVAKSRGQLGRVFKQAGISCEGVRSTDAALKRLADGEPPITGVLTDPLKGQYPQVMEAARQAGATAVLMTHSSLTLGQAKIEGVPAYMQGSLAGEASVPASIDSMISHFVSPVAQVQ